LILILKDGMVLTVVKYWPLMITGSQLYWSIEMERLEKEKETSRC